MPVTLERLGNITNCDDFKVVGDIMKVLTVGWYISQLAGENFDTNTDVTDEKVMFYLAIGTIFFSS